MVRKKKKECKGDSAEAQEIMGVHVEILESCVEIVALAFLVLVLGLFASLFAHILVEIYNFKMGYTRGLCPDPGSL